LVYKLARKPVMSLFPGVCRLSIFTEGLLPDVATEFIPLCLLFSFENLHLKLPLRQVVFNTSKVIFRIKASLFQNPHSNQNPKRKT
jgi:hypothetical protein